MVDMGNPVVDKNILDIINKNRPQQNVEITQVKIQPKQENKQTVRQSKPKNKGSVTIKKVTIQKTTIGKQLKKVSKKRKVSKPKIKTIIKKTTITKTKQAPKKDGSLKHVKELKKHVKSLASDVRKREKALQKRHTALQKQIGEHTEAVQDVEQQLAQTKQEVLETKAHYAHIPKLTLETQLMIESMNKLSAVVKQLLVLFNEKMSKEEGPLFAKLDSIMEQNEKIAEGMLAIADIVKEQQTPKAQIRDFNPYMQRQGPQPMQVRQQMPDVQQAPQLPQDLGKFQYPGAEQQAGEQMPQGVPQEQMQPIPQFGAPLPPFSAPQPQEQLPSRKRMLF